MNIVRLGLLFLLTIHSVATSAKDCADQFPIGDYGVPQSEQVFSEKLRIAGYEFIYLVKNRVELHESDCAYVTTSDVFRLSYEKKPEMLVAGCQGDFDGDSQRDIALILRNKKTNEVSPYVFLHRDSRYEKINLGEVHDRYGFDEDKHNSPGPFCLRKPKSGIFVGPHDPEQYHVVGDLIVVGWLTYFWSRNTFKSTFTTD